MGTPMLHPRPAMLRWVGIGGVAISVTACMSAVQATDGSVGGDPPRHGFAALGGDMATALARSAARDIPCDEYALALAGANVETDVYAVEGCGQRVTYCLSSGVEEDGRTHRLFLIARLPLSPSGEGP
jgi:hypothetical protein